MMERDNKKKDFAEIEINSACRIKYVHVKSTEGIRTVFWGNSGKQSFHHSTRINLPSELQSREKHEDAEIQSRDGLVLGRRRNW